MFDLSKDLNVFDTDQCPLWEMIRFLPHGDIARRCGQVAALLGLLEGGRGYSRLHAEVNLESSEVSGM